MSPPLERYPITAADSPSVRPTAGTSVPAIDNPVPLLRRLMAVLYDGIAVSTLLLFSAFVPVLAGGGAIEPGNPLFRIYLVAVMFGYFGVCWTRGCTLGMQAWKIAILAEGSARRPTWREALLRFAGAAVSLASGGLGYFAALFDAEGRTWHDRWSGTRLVRRELNARGNA